MGVQTKMLASKLETALVSSQAMSPMNVDNPQGRQMILNMRTKDDRNYQFAPVMYHKGTGVSGSGPTTGQMMVFLPKNKSDIECQATFSDGYIPDEKYKD